MPKSTKKSTDKKVACNWAGCGASFVSNWARDRHCYQQHWPWYVAPYVCHYCNRGFDELHHFEHHVQTDSHNKRQQAKLASEETLMSWEEELDREGWISRSYDSGKISTEQHSKLTKIQLTADTVTEALSNQTTKEPTQTETEQYDPENPLIINNQTNTMPTLSYQDMDSMLQELVSPPTTSNYTPSTSTLQRSNINTPQIQTSHSTNIPQSNSSSTSTLHSNSNIPQIQTGSNNQHPLTPPQDATSTTTHQSPAPLPPKRQYSVYPDPVLAMNPEHGSKRRRMSEVLRDATSVEDGMAALGEAVDCLHDRLDAMERSLKEKMVEAAQDQSQHIMGELKKFLRGDARKTQQYTKSLFEILSKELRERDGC